MQLAQQVSESILFKDENPLVLECGDTLQNLEVQYTTHGELNSAKTNVVWVFHALTANSDPTEWWNGLVGEGCFFDPEKYFIVCANMLGSCYGTTGPTNQSFPMITIKDMVKVHQRLHAHLSLNKIKIGIGGSMGGQQLLEWVVQEPSLFETIVPIATNAEHSSWGIAFNETQRMALAHTNSEKGIEIARAIAMLSYRSYEAYEKKLKDEDNRIEEFSASSYQQYQGRKLQKRFSALSYYCLSKAMDSHNIGRKNGGIKAALGRIQSYAIVIGLESDTLFPVVEQKRIADGIRTSNFHSIPSVYGHDGFLIEVEGITNVLENIDWN